MTGALYTLLRVCRVSCRYTYNKIYMITLRNHKKSMTCAFHIRSQYVHSIESACTRYFGICEGI